MLNYHVFMSETPVEPKDNSRPYKNLVSKFNETYLEFDFRYILDLIETYLG
jgi:hypothetical protein